ncbi:MAG: hypothetical protein HOW73_05560 [Polyangiaceae bacterium]|nr:hypothetical protein [Polyangiaceae bacterium]
MTTERVTISLSRDEALVLFEWVARANESSIVEKSRAEQLVLWILEGALEKSLKEIFDPDYRSLLAQSAARVVAEHDAPDEEP